MTKSIRSIEEKAIPGIALVSESVYQSFIASEEGQLFKRTIFALSKNHEAPLSVDPMIARIRRFSIENNTENLASLQRRIQNSAPFLNLKHEIIKQKLIGFYPAFAHVSEERLDALARTDYSQALFSQSFDERTKENWFESFVRDETQQSVDILEQCRLNIIKSELIRCYPYYSALTEQEQDILAQKSYSIMAFFSYSLSTAREAWLDAWAEDSAPDILEIKANEKQAYINKKINSFDSYFSYLDQNEQALLAQKPYSLALLPPSSIDDKAWLISFHSDESPEIAAIKAKKKLRLIKNKIRDYYPAYIYLDDNQRNQLANTWYSKNCLSNIPIEKNEWLQALADDRDESIQNIKKTVFEAYQYNLGFLFKKNKNEHDWQTIISYIYSLNHTEQQKVALLSTHLNQDWSSENKFWSSIYYKVDNSLSYFLKYPTQEAQKYVDDIANAHAFYRFFGMSSDNVVFGLQFEATERPGVMPIVNILDLYNYHKNRKAISEALNVWQALRIPLNLFLDEYLEIGRFEKNPLNICLRAFVPFLVMAFFLTLGYSLVLPLATHVFLEYLLFIPSLYLSIAGASLYLHARNEIYSTLIGWYYDGYFNSPLFLPNQRLKLAFNENNAVEDEASLAELVSRYYAGKFEECEKIETDFSKRKGLMDSSELKLYQQYSKLKFELYLEWYDIHERTNVPIDQMPKIVQNRLKTDRVNLLKKIYVSNNEYVSKYSQQYLTFFQDDKNTSLRDQCANRNKSLLELEALALRIDQCIHMQEENRLTADANPTGQFMC